MQTVADFLEDEAEQGHAKTESSQPSVSASVVRLMLMMVMLQGSVGRDLQQAPHSS